MDDSQGQNLPRIAYMLKRFPRQTFILHVILELERQGLPVRIFSLFEPPSTAKVPEASQEVRAPVTYLPLHFLRRMVALLTAAARCFLKAPWRFLCIARSAVLHYRQPFVILKHLL